VTAGVLKKLAHSPSQSQAKRIFASIFGVPGKPVSSQADFQPKTLAMRG
jgi:hypothetical protein